MTLDRSLILLWVLAEGRELWSRGRHATLMIKPYLILYNAASAAGWAYVLFLAVTGLAAEKTPTEAWATFGEALTLVQSTMALEIVHALLGFVRSPVFVTALQVSSRLWVIWGATVFSTDCQVS